MTYRSRLRFLLEGLEGIVVFLLVSFTWPVSKRWLRDWGARAEEREGAWPGDDLVEPPRTTLTRAIEIFAPSGTVWPWVAQFGLGRAGFYSYELLERLVGIPVKNVESIAPELQHPAVGDRIRLFPKVPGIPIAKLHVGRLVCFGELSESTDREAGPDPQRSWSIYIEPSSSDSCRLLIRGCTGTLRSPSLFKRLATRLEVPVDFVFEQRMLRTIKRLAELRR